MKKKNSTRDNLNLFFSAFLVVAYIVCAYFFLSFASTLTGMMQSVVVAAVFVVFGLLLFYATRVGDGKTVTRFSLITLILLDLPALYVILAGMIPALPLNVFLTANSGIIYMAAVALGYGIPYTFISGFETVYEEETEVMESVTEEADEEAHQQVEEEEDQETDSNQEVTVSGEALEEEDEIVIEGVNADAEE